MPSETLHRFRAKWLTVITVISLLLAIAAVVFGLYWYNNPRVPNPVPSYAVLPDRSLLVQGSTAGAGGLGVMYNGEAVSGQDITAATLYIWNDGPAPMRAADVLSPFKIVLPPESKILDIRVLGETRPVCGVRGDRIEAEPNKAALGFNILENGDGARIQVIYSGRHDAAIGVEGQVVGAPGVMGRQIANGQKLAQSSFVDQIVFQLLTLLLLGICIFLFQTTLKEASWSLTRERGVREMFCAFPGYDDAQKEMLASSRSKYDSLLKKNEARINYVRILWVAFGIAAIMGVVNAYIDIRAAYFPFNDIPQQLYWL